jgi:hypothetical protein
MLSAAKLTFFGYGPASRRTICATRTVGRCLTC